MIEIDSERTMMAIETTIETNIADITTTETSITETGTEVITIGTETRPG